VVPIVAVELELQRLDQPSLLPDEHNLVLSVTMHGPRSLAADVAQKEVLPRLRRGRPERDDLELRPVLVGYGAELRPVLVGYSTRRVFVLR